MQKIFPDRSFFPQRTLRETDAEPYMHGVMRGVLLGSQEGSAH